MAYNHTSQRMLSFIPRRGIIPYNLKRLLYNANEWPAYTRYAARHALHHSWTKYRKRVGNYRDHSHKGGRIKRMQIMALCARSITRSRETKKDTHDTRLRVNLSLIGKSFHWFPTIDRIQRRERGKWEKGKREGSEGKRKEEDVAAKSCLITRGSSKKYFNCAFFLSKIRSVIADLSDFSCWQLPTDNYQNGGFHDRMFVRLKANFMAVAFYICIERVRS